MPDEYNHAVKIFVDFSLHTKTAAFGRVSGYLSLPLIPLIGDSLSFGFGGNGPHLPDGSIFSGICKVENRLIEIDGDIDCVILDLGVISLESDEDAKIVMRSFESEYNFSGERFEF